MTEPNPAGFGSVSFFGRGGTNVTVIRSETPSLPAHLRFVAVGQQRAGSGRSAVCCMGRRLSCRHRPSCRRSAGIGVGINCGRAYFFISDRVFRRGGVILIVRAVAEAAYGMPDPLRSSPFEPPKYECLWSRTDYKGPCRRLVRQYERLRLTLNRIFIRIRARRRSRR